MSETLVALGEKLGSSLPAQFLMLVLLNLFFVLGLLWFLNASDQYRFAAEQHAIEARERLLAPVLAECIRQANSAAGQPAK
jgi:hypothetical protein